MKRHIIRAGLVGCALCSLPMNGFFIINSSTSPKKIEVIASIPVGNGSTVKPQVVLKKELKPDAIIEAPFALKEVVLDIHWGEEKTIPTEKTTGKSMKTTQYSLFRRFAASEAEPAPFVRGVPAVLGEDHVFEISGSDYATDINFMYVPDSKEPEMKRRKIDLSAQSQEKNRHEMSRRKKETFRQSRVRRSKKTSTVNGEKAA